MRKVFYISFVVLFFYGCGIYSFTGASYGNAKTVTVKYFDNTAQIVNPDLAPMITEKLRDKFNDESPLTLVESGGDLDFSGVIIKYDVKPVDIRAGEVAGANRLTVSVRVKFVNNTDHKYDYDKTFSWYADFEPDKNLADVENELIDQITDKLVEDIFNNAVANW